jgi:hypothetical protein
MVNLKKFSFNEIIYRFQKRDSSDRVIFSGAWKNGQREGDWYYYDGIGRVSHIDVYRNGENIERIEGERIGSVPVDTID